MPVARVGQRAHAHDQLAHRPLVLQAPHATLEVVKIRPAVHG
ncbi:MAG: hypothetical protein ACRDL4_21565 [Thermoleophilaceae bacterium]